MRPVGRAGSALKAIRLRPGSAGSSNTSIREVQLTDDGVTEVLDAGGCWRTSCAAHRVRKASLRVLSSPTRSVSALSTGRDRPRTQRGHGVVGGPFPVDPEVVRARVEEVEPGVVRPAGPDPRRPAQTDASARCSRPARPTDRCSRSPAVASSRRGPVATLGRICWPALCWDGPGCRPGGPGQVGQMLPLGLVELERAGERVQHALRDPD